MGFIIGILATLLFTSFIYYVFIAILAVSLWSFIVENYIIILGIISMLIALFLWYGSVALKEEEEREKRRKEEEKQRIKEEIYEEEKFRIKIKKELKEEIIKDIQI